MIVRRRLPVLAALAALIAAVAAAPARPTALADRTFMLSEGINGTSSDGASGRPAVNGSGSTVAFDSTATNLAADPNGPVRDVFAVSEGNVRLVSQAPGGAGADGPSRAPAVAATAPVVVFESDAGNLVPNDAAGQRDVFWRSGEGPVYRLSVGHGAVEANGPSGEADVSADGRRVVFTSAASNLVANDTNGVEDVFLRDLTARSFRRISIYQAEPNGPSRAPAISPDGRYVTFTSAASNLVARDTNKVADVFLLDLQTNKLDRVSISSGNLQQNASVAAPFVQVSDVSDGGRYVAFDSDATNLVVGDSNRDTDVFVRDRERRVTERVSVEPGGGQTNNDSFYPVISARGGHVAFQSFAESLSPHDAAGQDTFVFDRETVLPSLVTTTNRGRRRGPETARQLLQRPAITADGRQVAFASTAGNLVAGDRDGAEDVFLRLLAAPRARLRGSVGVRGGRATFRLAADDRAATFRCTVDDRAFDCGARSRTPRLRRGRHTLRVWAGGTGMLFQERPLTRRFRVP